MPETFPTDPSTRPFERLKDTIPPSAPNEEDERILKEALAHLALPLGETPTPKKPTTKETLEEDAYLVKTAHLIADKLAEHINQDRLMLDALEHGKLVKQNDVLIRKVKHLMDQQATLLEDKKALQAELDAFKETALGLYRKTSS